MSRRRGARYRAVSPEGKRYPFRRSLGAALRDGVYQLKGWGALQGGVKICIDCATAQAFAGDLVAAGWTFEVLR